MRYLLLCFSLCITSLGIRLYQNKPKAESIADGEEIYADFCAQCHLPNGKGVAGSFPPLAQSDYLLNNLEESIRGVKYGMKGEIVVNGKTYNNQMISQGLDNDEIADVMNYILNTWGNSSEKTITENDVENIRPN